jgi:hypothetical protein
VKAHHDDYVRAVEEGDLFLVNGWFGGEGTAKLYREAAEHAPWRVTLGAGGSILLQAQRDGTPDSGTRLAGAKALKGALAPRLKGIAAVPPRRVWVVYDKTATPAQVSAVLQAIADAGGIVAWSSEAAG